MMLIGEPIQALGAVQLIWDLVYVFIFNLWIKCNGDSVAQPLVELNK